MKIGSAPQMCRIHGDFKHFRPAEAKDFRTRRKVSSIISAKLLSIMRANAAPVTSD